MNPSLSFHLENLFCFMLEVLPDVLWVVIQKTCSEVLDQSLSCSQSKAKLLIQVVLAQL